MRRMRFAAELPEAQRRECEGEDCKKRGEFTDLHCFVLLRTRLGKGFVHHASLGAKPYTRTCWITMARSGRSLAGLGSAAGAIICDYGGCSQQLFTDMRRAAGL